MAFARFCFKAYLSAFAILFNRASITQGDRLRALGVTIGMISAAWVMGLMGICAWVEIWIGKRFVSEWEMMAAIILLSLLQFIFLRNRGYQFAQELPSKSKRERYILYGMGILFYAIPFAFNLISVSPWQAFFHIPPCRSWVC